MALLARALRLACGLLLLLCLCSAWKAVADSDDVTANSLAQFAVDSESSTTNPSTDEPVPLLNRISLKDLEKRHLLLFFIHMAKTGGRLPAKIGGCA